jgi:hypothetical protein
MVVYFTLWKGQNMDLNVPNLVPNPRKDASILGERSIFRLLLRSAPLFKNIDDTSTKWLYKKKQL